MRLSLACFVLLLSVSFVFAQDEPEETETPEPQTTITIWWPDVFARVNEADINPILIDQSNAFTEQTSNVPD